MFQNQIANILQQVAVFLEVIGLTLVLLDMYSKEFSEKLENVIDDIPNKIRYTTKICAFGVIEGSLVFYSITVGPWLMYYEGTSTPPPEIRKILVAFWFFAFCFFFAVYFMRAVSLFIDFLNRISRGRAMSGIGLILTGIGCSFEIYQVITLCLYEGCYWQPPVH